MASGWRTPLTRASPTAQALLAEMPATLFSWSPAGLGTRVHFLPFQARMSVPVPVKPTDQALLAPHWTARHRSPDWGWTPRTTACRPSAQ